jgi:hypothetical protein
LNDGEVFLNDEDINYVKLMKSIDLPLEKTSKDFYKGCTIPYMLL